MTEMVIHCPLTVTPNNNNTFELILCTGAISNHWFFSISSYYFTYYHPYSCVKKDPRKAK